MAETEHSIVVSYSAHLFRISVEFSKADAVKFAAPPVFILEKAKARLERLIGEKKINFYYLNETLFAESWRALAQDFEAKDSRRISLTLGVGAPTLKDLQVKVDPSKKSPTLTFKGDLPSKWVDEWTHANIQKLLLDQNYTQEIVKGRISALAQRIALRQSLEDAILTPLSSYAPMVDLRKPFQLFFAKGSKEILLSINQIAYFQSDPKTHAHLISTLRQAAHELAAETSSRYVILQDEIKKNLDEALKGPESIGINLPLMLLGALVLESEKDEKVFESLHPKTQAAAQTPKPTQAAKPKPVARPPKPNPVPAEGANPPAAATGEAEVESPPLTIAIAPDETRAWIENFDLMTYEKMGDKFNWSVIEQEIQKANIAKQAVRPELRSNIEKLIGEKASLNGKDVATLVPGVSAAEPYLHPAYLDVKKEESIEGAVNMRQQQQREIVRAGSVVARIRFKKPAQPSMLVTGKPGPMPPMPPFSVPIDETVEPRGEDVWIAKIEGIPKIEGMSLSISKIMRHQGDVTLKSGDIFFDGPVEISGSITAGSTVRVKGPLIVHGSIEEAVVVSQEEITVQGGIVTGQKGYIHTGKTLKASFISSSRITARKDVMVEKSILNSEVFAGGSVVLPVAESVLAGGVICAYEKIEAFHIGIATGQKTIIKMGTPYEIEVRAERLRGRQQRVGEKYERDRANLKELQGRSPDKLSARLKEERALLAKQVVKGKRILNKLEEFQKKNAGASNRNMDARCIAKGILRSTVSVYVGSNAIPIKDDVAEAMVTAKPMRGSHISALSEQKPAAA